MEKTEYENFILNNFSRGVKRELLKENKLVSKNIVTFLLRQGYSKEDVEEFIEQSFVNFFNNEFFTDFTHVPYSYTKIYSMWYRLVYYSYEDKQFFLDFIDDFTVQKSKIEKLFDMVDTVVTQEEFASFLLSLYMLKYFDEPFKLNAYKYPEKFFDNNTYNYSGFTLKIPHRTIILDYIKNNPTHKEAMLKAYRRNLVDYVYTKYIDSSATVHMGIRELIKQELYANGYTYKTFAQKYNTTYKKIDSFFKYPTITNQILLDIAKNTSFSVSTIYISLMYDKLIKLLNTNKK